MAPRKLHVLYDFAAEETGEVSVRAGDAVSLVDDSNAERDGWVLVETAAGTQGFVPADYLQPLSAAAAPAPQSASAATPAPAAPSPSVVGAPRDDGHVGVSPSTVYPGHSVSQFNSPANGGGGGGGPATGYGASMTLGGAGGALAAASAAASLRPPPGVSAMEALAFARAPATPAHAFNGPSLAGALPGGGATGGGGPGGPGGVPPLVTPEEYAHLFASHEEWFRQATAKRQETYRMLQGEAMDIIRAMTEAESRASSVLARVAELDGLIAEERAKWAAKIQDDAIARAGATGAN